MIIVKNWLEKDLHEFLKFQYLHNTPHYLSQKSNRFENLTSDNCFYISEFNQKDLMNSFLCLKIQKTINKKLKFLRTYLNIQHVNMNGSWHIDDDAEITCLYMVIGNGNFEIKNETSILFEENKLICFDSKKIHRGLAPNKGTRITWTAKSIVDNSIGEKNETKNN